VHLSTRAAGIQAQGVTIQGVHINIEDIESFHRVLNPRRGSICGVPKTPFEVKRAQVASSNPGLLLAEHDGVHKRACSIGVMHAFGPARTPIRSAKNATSITFDHKHAVVGIKAVNIVRVDVVALVHIGEHLRPGLARVCSLEDAL
jgi:hypothetical protein